MGGPRWIHLAGRLPLVSMAGAMAVMYVRAECRTHGTAPGSPGAPAAARPRGRNEQAAGGILFRPLPGDRRRTPPPDLAIAGRVVDRAGRPVAGATVEVIDTSAGFRRAKVTTDRDGGFRFDELGPDPVEVAVRSPGRRPVSPREVPVDAAGLRIEIEPSTP